jgi:SET domain-containing protein
LWHSPTEMLIHSQERQSPSNHKLPTRGCNTQSLIENLLSNSGTKLTFFACSEQLNSNMCTVSRVPRVCPRQK